MSSLGLTPRAGADRIAARLGFPARTASWRPAITPRTLAKEAARIAHELKARDITILDVRKLCQITDFMVVCTGDNRRQLRAVRNRIGSDLKGRGLHPPHTEGEDESGWVLLDFVDVVVHLFGTEEREFYDLELLWGDAPRVKWERAARKG